MNHILDVPASTREITEHYHLHEYFHASADALYYQIAHEGVARARQGQMGMPGADYYNQHAIVSIYLIRHAIELGLKATYFEVTQNDFSGRHDIEKLWDDIKSLNCQAMTQTDIDAIDAGMAILGRLNLLKDEQLFRYHTHKKGSALDGIGVISTSEFDMLFKTSGTVRHLCLKCKHINLGYPL